MLVEENKLAVFWLLSDIAGHESMQRLQDSQTKLMEQSGWPLWGNGGESPQSENAYYECFRSMIAVENLVEECQRSLGDPEVTPEDYREIYQKLDEWVNKVRKPVVYVRGLSRRSKVRQ